MMIKSSLIKLVAEMYLYCTAISGQFLGTHHNNCLVIFGFECSNFMTLTLLTKFIIVYVAIGRSIT